MGVSIWYVPTGNDRAVKIDLGDYVTNLQERPDVSALSAQSLSGGVSRTVFASRMRVRIALERFSSASLERSLQTLQTHLDLGGSIAFARVESKAWAGYTSSALPARTTAIITRGNTWSFGQSASLAATDEVVVWGGTPEGLREYDTVSAFTSPTVTLTSGLRFGYTQGPLLVRHRDYYPCLRRLPDDSNPILTHERRIVHTLDMELIEDTAVLAEAATWSPGVLPTTSGGSARGPDTMARSGLRLSPSGKR